MPNDQGAGREQAARPPGPDLETVLGLGRGPRRWLRGRARLWLGAAGLAALVLAGVFVWRSMVPGNGIRYVTAPAAKGDLTVVVTATGTVQPTNKVDVSSELSGIIRKVLVDYNSVVKVGQPLAELDTDKLKAAVESARAKVEAARAQVAQAEATVEETKLDYQRRAALVERKVASVKDLEAAKAALDRARASLASARADVAAALADLHVNETNLTKACICSPIDGIVLSRNVEPGMTVASSFQAPVLFTLADDLSKIEVQVDVDEADVGKVKEGQSATFSVDAYPDRKFPAVIRSLRYGSEVVQGVVTYKAVLSAENPDMLLRPGMTATAEITVHKVTNAMTVPNAALRFTPPSREPQARRGGSLLTRILPIRPRFRPASRQDESGPKRTVWVLRNGAPVAVPVTVGATDGKRTEIVDGAIQAGQRVIVDAVTSRT